MSEQEAEQYNSAAQAGDYVRRFVIVASVAMRHYLPARKRALAFADLAHLTAMEPQLSIGDTDSGLFYIREAFKLDDQCLPAATAAILQFSSDVTDCTRHHDNALINQSIKIFEASSIEVPEPVRRLCKEAIARRRSE